ncbi:MAG: glycerol kinase, partial [Alistipes sp.]|nr:glycerol kinase [Alistipes sp.]
KLTGGEVHATDYTNASRTLLFNIHTLDWDEELCSLFTVPRTMLPKALPCDAVFGRTTIEGLFPEGIEIAGVLGDSHGALAGQMCFEAGMGKATYGTGSSVMVNIGEEAVAAPEGLVTSVGFAAKGKVFYAFEGNIHCTGATLRWLADQLQLIGSPAETEALATSVESTNGVYLVPAFAGLGAPWWNSEAKAIIAGMTLGTTKAHVVRAALEAIPYQIKDLVDLMTGQAGVKLKELRVDGGPTRNRFLMQFQADMLNATINRADIEEASAMGAVVMNGLARGVWATLDEVAALRTSDNRIEPKMTAEEREALHGGWIEAVKLINRK